jgi:hypothetical protein
MLDGQSSLLYSTIVHMCYHADMRVMQSIPGTGSNLIATAERTGATPPHTLHPLSFSLARSLFVFLVFVLVLVLVLVLVPVFPLSFNRPQRSLTCFLSNTYTSCLLLCADRM